MNGRERIKNLPTHSLASKIDIFVLHSHVLFFGLTKVLSERLDDDFRHRGTVQFSNSNSSLQVTLRHHVQSLL